MDMVSLLASFWHKCIGMPRCLLCHGWASVSGLCQGCWADLRILRRDIADLCPRCTTFSEKGSICGQCLHRRPALTALYASYLYAPPLQQLLHAFKHQRQLAILDTLSALMLAEPPAWLQEGAVDAVLAMPLSRKRLFERGFNQSQMLAEIVAKRYELPLIRPHLVERSHRPPQSTLKGNMRQHNVRGVFRVRGTLKDCRILLIDDVVTTGATISELARALKRCGVAQIYAWTLTHPR